MAKSKDAFEDFEKFFRKVKQVLPAVFESSLMEAAEVTAIHLDKATRFILHRNPTGTLANSWNPVLNGPLSAGAYSDLPYAEIHETGGVIRPKRAKALSIPISKAARNAGSPRNMPGLVMTGSKPPMLMSLFPLNLHYVLLKSVTIPGRGYITLAANTAAKDVEEILGNGVHDIFAGKSAFGVS